MIARFKLGQRVVLQNRVTDSDLYGFGVDIHNKEYLEKQILIVQDVVTTIGGHHVQTRYFFFVHGGCGMSNKHPKRPGWWLLEDMLEAYGVIEGNRL